MEKFKPVVCFLDPKTLIPYQKNIKKHPPEQVEKIAKSISTYGFDQPIVVDKQNIIIKGHGRREAALKLGLETVPVVVAEHLTEAEAMAARIADNKVAESKWDSDLLKIELEALKGLDFDLSLTGFDDDFLKDDPTEDIFNDEVESEKEQKKCPNCGHVIE